MNQLSYVKGYWNEPERHAEKKKGQKPDYIIYCGSADSGRNRDGRSDGDPVDSQRHGGEKSGGGISGAGGISGSGGSNDAVADGE